jgi:hypothetical protein
MVQKSQKTSRKRGRPPLAAGEGKRFPLNMRTTKHVREKLEAEAKLSGRSLAQEVEFRLERSFLEQDALYDEFGGKERFNMMKWFALAMRLSERITEQPLETDRETFRIAAKAMLTMLETGMPDAGGLSDEAADDIGGKLGKALIAAPKKTRDKSKSE